MIYEQADSGHVLKYLFRERRAKSRYILSDMRDMDHCW